MIDNERVTVWDLTLTKGVAGPVISHELDTLVMFMEGGRIQTAGGDAKSTVVRRAFGDAAFFPKGSGALQHTLLSDGVAREIVVAFKEFGSPPIENTSGYPAAFPRSGSVKVLENNRVVVWSYSWIPNVPTPMHFHDKDIVVGFRYDGSLKSVTPDGASVVNPYQSGDIRFNKGNRSHYEQLTSGRQSAMMAELK